MQVDDLFLTNLLCELFFFVANWSLACATRTAKEILCKNHTQVLIRLAQVFATPEPHEIPFPLSWVYTDLFRPGRSRIPVAHIPSLTPI